jgi:hypothetical protein
MALLEVDERVKRLKVHLKFGTPLYLTSIPSKVNLDIDDVFELLSTQ